MEQQQQPKIKLANALLKNTKNPKLAWQLFKRTSLSTPNLFFQSLPIITRILLRSSMFSEIDSLHHFLLSQPPVKNSSLYTVVRILAESGHVDKALSQFQTLRAQFPDRPPLVSLYNLLIQSSLKGDCQQNFVSWLYKDMIFAGILPETYTFNLMIGGLCDSGRLEDAQKLFDKMREKGCEPNEFSFGILVRGYCRVGLASKGLELLDLMKEMDVFPNLVIYNTLIACFCKEGKTEEAEKLVEQMREDGLVPDVVTFNSRISALCKSGNMLEASRIFRDMQMNEELGLPKLNTITFNLMLEGFCNEGMLDEAKTLVQSMKQNDVFPNVESYNIWLYGLVRNKKVFDAQLVLKDMVDQGVEPSTYSYNIVMNGLCKNGMLGDARMLMGLMTSGGISPDTVTYSTLLHGYCCKGKVVEANRVLHEMMKNGYTPNNYTCNILLHSLWKEGKISEAEKLLQKMNEGGCDLDIVSCNIVIDGLCRTGRVDKAVEIVSEMWTHGSAALGNIGNSFIGLVDEGNNGKKCMPDLITYSTIISGLCNDGRLDEAKKKFVEMMKKNLYPDSVVYNTFLYNLCKKGKVSSAFQVLKDMEKKGCNKNLNTYNSLILGLRSKSQIFEMSGLMDEMRERGISPNVFTCNTVISCLCEAGRTEEAISLLEEMLQKGTTTPNTDSFEFLIKAFCRAGEFRPALDVFDIALDICGHKEALYAIIFNEMLTGGETLEAKVIFEAAMNRYLCLGNFLYTDLIDRLCKDEKFEEAHEVLNKMISKGYGFDPASFMPVIDALTKRGRKHEADELSERMLNMAAQGRVVNKVYFSQVDRASSRGKLGKLDRSLGSHWQTILHREDGSSTALKTLKRVQKGWGQGSVSSLQVKRSDYLDEWDAAG
ncbi:pentatricopeptide repeat-containing protein At2g17140-like [Coffea eugenioides]|uniref:pentatricopeptide repeat-containing protein At2g17140-like n=1 Tax=Coffea eugenioides TaxID=49369 RepID=UPI000F607286|nr:pentatricopeptide repeat-containing protein At2g17140-like [Coffea eugenioides]